ncbi:MAG: DNA polymerase III subunit [bacterium]|nr:DNA polymerase III subunit [bacterium]
MFGKEVRGQEKAIYAITCLIKREVLPTLIFYGPEGVGKRRAAYILARTINCSDGGENSCSSCRQMEKGIHPDLVVLESNNGSIKVDSIREVIKSAYLKPFYKKKVYIIDDASLLTPEASSCLLKTLEEPPLYCVFILITNSIPAIFSTIRSRCLPIRFRRQTEEIQREILLDLGVDRKDIDDLIKFSGGSLSRAMEYKGLNLSLKESQIEKWFASFKTKNAIDIAEDILFAEKSFPQFLDFAIFYLEKELPLHLERIEAILEAKEYLLLNANRRLTLENMCFKLQEVCNDRDSWFSLS